MILHLRLRNLLHGIFLYLLFDLLFPVAVGGITNDEFNRKWSPILSELNQEPSPVSFPYLHKFSQDLLKTNARELAGLKQQWQSFAGRELKALSDKKKIRRLRNEYFHRKIVELNERDFEPFELFIKKAVSLKSEQYLKAKQALLYIEKNPVASIAKIRDFDRGDELGFCFARALLVHYLLLKRGIPQKDLAKVFAVGDLLVENTMWRFHVAILVRTPTSGILVVDPLYKNPMTYRDWQQNVRSLGVKHPLSRLRFYVTDPRKFMPGAGKYSLELLSYPALKAYFSALAQTL